MKLRLFTLAPLLLVAVALAGCGGGGGGGGSKLGASDVLVVGPQHVSLAAYNTALSEERANFKQQGSTFPKPGTSAYQQMQTAILDTLVQQAEFSIEAKKLHLAVASAAVAAQVKTIIDKQFGGSTAKYLAGLKSEGYTDAELRQAIAERLLELKLFDSVTKAAKATPAEIQAYYEQNLSLYQTPATRKVREILAGKNKKALAEQIYAQLKSGSGTYETLAKRYSQDPGSKDKGGQFTATDGRDVPAFDAAVFAPSAKTGVVLKPVNTPQYGWFVIEPVGSVTPAVTKPESEEAASIRKTLDTTQEQASFEKWVATVAKGFCGDSQINYRAGYSPSPDPCASVTTPQATTT
jgi:parvulin-like peptidyl-prolyl isomerase